MRTPLAELHGHSEGAMPVARRLASREGVAIAETIASEPTRARLPETLMLSALRLGTRPLGAPPASR